ncbi:fimbrial protein [Providencia rettgeri]|uniref:fimbrial protein n=1 Tax=Providencia rettgeri TaxID=587 RepID=UPI0001C3484B|nr:type 1 fimbrial protein [Providencia rettgeri]QXA57392.1 type 1 fimbrial protein [Providencia rettgeri]
MRLFFSTNNIGAILVAGYVLFGVAPLSQAGTGSTQLNFTATFVNGTCDISTNRGATAASAISWSGTPADVAGGVLSNENFDILFDNCATVVGLTPKLKITGTQITAGAGNLLFRDSGTSTGYGIKLVKQGSTVPIVSGDVVVRAGWTAATDNLSTLTGKTETFTAYLSCGSTCGTATPGDLRAAVKFEFLYN